MDRLIGAWLIRALLIFGHICTAITIASGQFDCASLLFCAGYHFMSKAGNLGMNSFEMNQLGNPVRI